MDKYSKNNLRVNILRSQKESIKAVCRQQSELCNATTRPPLIKREPLSPQFR